MPMRAIKDSHGRIISHEFKPTLKMQKVVIEMNKAENAGLSNEEILRKCEVSKAQWERWWNEYEIIEPNPDGTVKSRVNYFETWFDDALQIKSGEERALLREIGMQKALEGDYQFWKDMSRTYGAQSTEPLVPTRKKIPFNLPTNATPEQLREARQKLLESQRAMGDGAGVGLARLSARGPKGSGT